MDRKRFKIEDSRLTGFGVSVFLCLVLGLFLCSKISDDFEEKLLKYVIICGSIGLILGIVVFVIAKNTYLQIVDDGFEVIKGNIVTKYYFSDFAGTNVVKHYTNGIPSGTTREIKIKKPGEKEIKIDAGHLSEKEFSELASFLGKAQYDKTHDEITPSEVFFDKTVFAIPGKAILEANRNILAFYTLSAIVCAVLGVILTFSFDSGNIMQFIGICGIAGSVAILILEIFPWGKIYLNVRSVPSYISIDSLAITIDSEVFKADTITNISMVPSSYEILTRDLIITTRDGAKHKYNFGKGGKKDKYTYVGYPDLYSAIKLWCIAQKIDFNSILG